MDLTPGARLGPYEVLAPLGAGGMGAVWRARDSRLDREVAIKVMAHEMAEDTAWQARFEREARAASALNHPNILSVFDVGEYAGARYIVTELVQGRSLRELIARGPLPHEEFARISSQIGDALKAAHAAGIVHRDLKPENIMVTDDGRVKILDFGLARRTRPQGSDTESTATQTTLTRPGAPMGTAGYMSPEQICGEEADHRSDIFSAGVVLYEMAAGARAFPGRTSIEMMSAILKDAPAPLPAKESPKLDLVIRRCLEKEPAKRFQSATDMTIALEEAIEMSGKTGGKRRLAWIVGASAAAAAAAVTTTFSLRDSHKPPATLASVSAPAPAGTSTPALPPAPPAATKSNEPAPAPSPGPPPDKQAVSKSPVTPAKPPPKTAGGDPAKQAAYEQAYAEGMMLLSQRKFAEAATRLTEAITLKPDSAMAYLGRCHAGMEKQEFDKAIQDCTEVIQRLPNAPDAYHDRGTAYLMTQQFDKSVQDMNAALRLGDKEAGLAYSVRARAHAGLKEWGDAISDMDESIRLNPNIAQSYLLRGMGFAARSQFRKAIEDFDQAIKLNPGLAPAYMQRALAKQRIGDAAGAQADRKQARTKRK